MRKTRKTVLSLGLITLMIALNPAKVLAENPKVEYVKEFTMASGASVKEAKKVLADAGYKAKEEPVSSSKKKVVLLGYKTTTKRSEAITDVKAMNEKGDFSSTNLQKSLENQSKEIKKMINQWKPAIQEFQKNYGDGTDAGIPAKLAKTAMDTLYEDDSKKLMGDFLLGLDLDKEDDVEALTSVLMQGNSYGISSLQDALTTACAEVQSTDEKSGAGNWIERYCSLSMAKNFDSKYADEAAILLECGKSVKDTLSLYFDTMKLEEVGGTSKGYNAYINKVKSENTTEAKEKTNLLSSAKAVYDMLHGHKCRIVRTEEGKSKAIDMDMTEFFQRDDLCDKDFYPMAEAMTAGQKSMLVYVGMQEMIVVSGKTAAKWKSAKKNADKHIQETFEGEKKKYISIYEGVNRKMFDQEMMKKGQIALTKSASEYCDLTGDYSWASDNSGKAKDGIYAKLNVASAVCFVTFLFSMALGGTLHMVANPDFFGFFTKVFTPVGKALVILGVVALIASVILAVIGKSMGDGNSNTAKEKPQIIVDESLLDIKGKDTAKIKGYVVYDAVTDPSGKIADCNGDTGNQWVCLYQTKYSTAGEPITTDFVLSNKLVNDSKYKEVQKFGSEGAVNLGAYNGQSKESMYMYVQKKVLDFGSAGSVGSAFANGTNLIFGGIGIVLGAIGYGALSGLKRKKVKADA